MPLDPDIIEDAIETTASGPSSVSVDGQSVQAQPLGDLIEAHKYASGDSGLNRNHRGLRFTKLVPPGTV